MATNFEPDTVETIKNDIGVKSGNSITLDNLMIAEGVLEDGAEEVVSSMFSRRHSKVDETLHFEFQRALLMVRIINITLPFNVQMS